MDPVVLHLFVLPRIRDKVFKTEIVSFMHAADVDHPAKASGCKGVPIWLIVPSGPFFDCAVARGQRTAAKVVRRAEVGRGDKLLLAGRGSPFERIHFVVEALDCRLADDVVRRMFIGAVNDISRRSLASAVSSPKRFVKISPGPTTATPSRINACWTRPTCSPCDLGTMCLQGILRHSCKRWL
jgi:hypothetical protein